MLADRCLETSTTTGVGDFTLAGAVAGFRTLYGTGVDQLKVNDPFSYAIEAVDASGNPTGAFENGNGVLLTSTTFSRSPSVSSNSDALVSFSAGTKYVYISLNADDIMTIGKVLALSYNIATP
jgi:hypothetical protein